MAMSARAGQTVTIGVAAMLGVLMLYFAVPRTIAAGLLMPGDEPLQILRNDGVPKAGGLAAVISSRASAAHWVDDGRLWTDLALARLVDAEQVRKDEAPDKAKLDAAASDLTKGLALSPVNPHAWARLGYVRLLQKNQAEVASALRLSFLTGPYEADMAIPRLRLALAVWSYFTTEEREMARRQIRFAWLLSRDEVVDLAVLSQRVLVFRLALVNQAQDLAIFDSMLKERRS